MADITNQNEAAAETAHTENNQQDNGSQVRIWPAVLIVLVYAAVAYGFSLLSSTAVQSVIGLAGVPLVALVLLIIWWFAASRVPMRDRMAGLVVFVAAQAVVVLSQKANGPILLAYSIPAMMTGAVAVLTITFWLRWTARRWAVVFYILICTGVFIAMRVDTVGGDLAPYVSWRWNANAGESAKTLPIPDVHNTAALPERPGPGDWPGFRGPHRDSHVVGVKFSTDWSTPPKELWRMKIGEGWSSFAAMGDYIFTQEQRGNKELVTCYLATTGEMVWVNSVDASREDTMGEGPRATPTFDQGKLFTQGATGIIQCLDAATGNTVWKRDLTKDTEMKVPTWGFSSSPLVTGDLAITFSGKGDGKSAIAYHRLTGEVVWRAGHGSPVYSSPHFAVLDGIPQILMTSDFGIESFVPETGASLWEHPWKIKTTPRCVQPLLVSNELVMVGTTFSLGSRLLRIQKKDASWDIQGEWTTKKFRPYFNDSVLHKGYCYGFDGDRFACIDIKTGDRKWDGNRYGGQVLLLDDMDTLLVLSEAGEVVLIQAIPDRFNEMARFKAISGKTWNHPVVAHGKLFVRNAEEAVCYELPVSTTSP
ncbi:MAG TPA: PQQ-binding-like beta-propeller repeat protein [Candidatus Hydrogenedentes bacterium]|nr:PQQ-binding-like beta-propeller repeat protein [Candidatus Hydrogenedentota bacterium]